MLTGIYHVQLPVRDIRAAMSWYESRLGFSPSAPPNEETAFLALPGDKQFLMLWRTDDPGRARFAVDGADFPVVLFRTENIHELHDRLVGDGVPIATFTGDDGPHWVLKFYDPDGNMWGVLQDN